ncbi:MAG: hypothetical protein EOP04_19430 [Proteobacteria bacterium]|nr:MAG: hypothetical protein EOP04_19430 [Pseudomonadota bacterium]
MLKKYVTSTETHTKLELVLANSRIRKGLPMGKKSKVADLFDDEKVEMVRTGVYLRKDVHDLLKAASEESGKSVNQIVNKILLKFFEE